jgi:hypothetical protein
MKDRRLGYIIVGVLCLVIGCTVASVSPVKHLWAQPAAGEWRCYIPSEGIQSSQNDAVRQRSRLLNQVASHTPSGTVFGMHNDLLCVKN